MNEFKKYVLDWYIDYLRDNQDNKDAMLKLYNAFATFLGKEELKKYPSNDDQLFDTLENIDDANVIYYNLFYCRESDDSNIPKTYTFLKDILDNVGYNLDLDHYSFFDDFITVIINKMIDYENPECFFKDLQYGGCVSGFIGEFIYNSDCLDFYKEYANSLEAFKEDLEDEFGMEFRQKNSTYYYVWIVWLSFEQFCNKLYNYLF